MSQCCHSKTNNEFMNFILTSKKNGSVCVELLGSPEGNQMLHKTALFLNPYVKIK